MEEQDNNESVKEEKEKLNKLGVSETWSLLKDSEAKKKDTEEKKTTFRGFQ